MAPTVAFKREGGTDVSFSRDGGFSATIDAIDTGFAFSARHIASGIKSAFYVVCATSLGQGFLCSCDARLLTYDGATMSVIEING